MRPWLTPEVEEEIVQLCRLTRLAHSSSSSAMLAPIDVSSRLMSSETPRRGELSSRLATYGSLRPGEQHHDLVAELAFIGTGSVRGRVTDWEGYPVLTIDPTGEHIPVVVFAGVSEVKWVELDHFEGPAYRLDQVEVVLEDGSLVVAGCYVAADSP